MPAQLRQRLAIKESGLFQSRTSRLVDATADQSELPRAVRIRRNRYHYAGLCGVPGVLGRKIEAIWTGIDLETAAVLTRSFVDAVHIDLVTGTLQQQATGRVAKDVEKGIAHRPKNSIRLLPLAQAEPRMDRADCVIEFPQDFVRIIERPVLQDIDFARFQYLEVPQTAIQLVNLANLVQQSARRDTACDLQALRVIGDADVLIPERLGGFSHFFDGTHAVAGSCMRVKVTEKIFFVDRSRQGVAGRTFNLISALPQFGLDVLKPKSSIKRCLSRNRDLTGLAGPQRARELVQLFQMRL